MDSPPPWHIVHANLLARRPEPYCSWWAIPVSAAYADDRPALKASGIERDSEDAALPTARALFLHQNVHSLPCI